MMSINKLVVLVILSTASCGIERTKAVNSEFYLIVPLRNCETCVDEIISFANANLDNHRIKVIFTSVERKLFKLKLSDRTLSASNILLDETGGLIKDGFIDHEFLLIQKDNGRIVDQKSLNAANLTSELLILGNKLSQK